MSKPFSIALPMLAAVLATTALADPAPAATPGPAGSSIFRFDVTVSSLDDNPKAAPTTYSIELEDDVSGALETGANVPMPGTASSAGQRMSTGVKLGLKYRLRGNVLVVNGEFELTALDPAAPSTFRRVRAEGTTAATPDTAAQLASVYDVQSHKRYDITVTAHRVL